MRMAIRIHQNTAAARLSLAAISLSQEEFLESNLKESPSGRNLDKATLIFFRFSRLLTVSSALIRASCSTFQIQYEENTAHSIPVRTKTIFAALPEAK